MILIVIFQDFVPLFHFAWMLFCRLNSAATNSEIMYYDYAFGMLKLEGMKE